jgi:hypothetical protein
MMIVGNSMVDLGPLIDIVPVMFIDYTGSQKSFASSAT